MAYRLSFASLAAAPTAVAVGLGYARHRRKLAQLLQDRDRHETINKIAFGLSAGMSSAEIIDVALREIATRFPEHRVSYSTVSAEGMLQVWSCISPATMPSIEGLEADLDVAPQYRDALLGLSILAVRDVFDDGRFAPLEHAMLDGNTRAILDIPITHNDGFVGLFCMDSSETHNWTDVEVRMLSETARYLELAIRQAENLELQEEMAERLRTYADDLEVKVQERTRELELAKQDAERLARTDELSHLPNRRAFFEAGERAVANAVRYGRPLSVLMVDADRFKDINDTHGHEAGDAALGRMGEILQSVTRAADVAGRVGGEEFAMVLPETGIDGAEQFAERLRSLVEATSVRTAQGDLRWTVSIGVGVLGESGNSLKTLMARADAALYRAKETGRNRVVVAERMDNVEV